MCATESKYNLVSCLVTDLSCSRYVAVITPHLFSWAKKSVVFDVVLDVLNKELATAAS